MTWNEHFVTGVPIIDEQHQWLIDLINTAAPVLSLNYKRNHEHAEVLLNQLVDYAIFHFETEDRLMQEAQIDPRHHALHLKSHGDFTGEVQRMRKEYSDGMAPTGARLMTFLAHWLVYHILGEDQALARQLRAIANGVSPSDAYETAEGSRRDPTHEALVQALIDVYTQMTDQNRILMEANHELEQHRHGLEALVAERTGELVRALDAAEAAGRARNHFIANMSHEIRTPMNAIVGLTWALRQNNQDPTQLARLDQISDSTQQLLTIVNDLLDMARIESNRLALEPLDFNPAKVIAEVMSSAAARAEEKQLYLRFSGNALPTMLRGDPIRLGQILGNFVNNAVKFTDRGGVEIRALTTALSTDRIRLRIEVEDSGIGIDPAAIPRLFNPFEQGDASSTRRFGGTGLGLAISKRLTDMMGGRMGVTSVPGKGSIFWVELPFVPVAAARTEDGLGHDPALRGSPDAAPAEGGIPRSTGTREREIMARMIGLLEDDDMLAITLWNENAQQLRRAFNGHLPSFESALNAYDFAAALVLLQQAMNADSA